MMALEHDFHSTLTTPPAVLFFLYSGKVDVQYRILHKRKWRSLQWNVWQRLEMDA